jgi:hypothetical protein
MAMSLCLLEYPLDVFSRLNLSLREFPDFRKIKTIHYESSLEQELEQVSYGKKCYRDEQLTSTIRFIFICQRHCEGWLTVCLCLT